MPNNQPELMIVTETLAMAWLDRVAARCGLRANRQRSVRAAIAACKQRAPAAVLAEYHFNPTYSSFTSSLESLIASLQRFAPATHLIVISEAQRQTHLQGIARRFPISAHLIQPLDQAKLESCLRRVAAQLSETSLDR